MSERLPLVLSVLGLVVVGGLSAANLWMTTGLEGRIAALEAERGELPRVAENEERPERRRSQRAIERTTSTGERRPAVAVADLPLDAESIDDPETREKLEEIIEETSNRNRQERRRERTNRMLESMTSEIADFAEEEGLDSRTEEEVLKAATEMFEQMGQIREDIRNGDLAWGDAREEFQSIREETETKLTSLIGEDGVESLRERMGGGRGPGRF